MILPKAQNVRHITVSSSDKYWYNVTAVLKGLTICAAYTVYCNFFFQVQQAMYCGQR